MPLYECSKCHAVENTALTNFWWKTNGEGAPALCSECDPGIGVWHGRFPKITVAEYRAQNANGEIKYPVLDRLAEQAGKEQDNG